MFAYMSIEMQAWIIFAWFKRVTLADLQDLDNSDEKKTGYTQKDRQEENHSHR